MGFDGLVSRLHPSHIHLKFEGSDFRRILRFEVFDEVRHPAGLFVALGTLINIRLLPMLLQTLGVLKFRRIRQRGDRIVQGGFIPPEVHVAQVVAILDFFGILAFLGDLEIRVFRFQGREQTGILSLNLCLDGFILVQIGKDGFHVITVGTLVHAGNSNAFNFYCHFLNSLF